jgi:hypothetical protein
MELVVQAGQPVALMAEAWALLEPVHLGQQLPPFWDGRCVPDSQSPASVKQSASGVGVSASRPVLVVHGSHI